MSTPVFASTDPHGSRRNPWRQTARAFIGLLVLGAAAVAGGLLSVFIERPKAIFLILLAMILWSVGGWLVSGWRSVLVGMAGLTAALAAANSNYVLLLVLSGVLFIFLSHGSFDQR